jgi:Protein of unknown function (DUF1236)
LRSFAGEPFITHSEYKSGGTAYIEEHHPICFRCRRGQCRHVRRNSMTNRFLISVAAAALIAGTGFANAQGTGMNRESPSAGSTTQQSSPSSDRGGASSGTMHKDSGGTSGMKSSEQGKKGSETTGMKGAESEKGQPGASGKSAQDNAPGQKSKSMSSETETKGGKDMKAEGRDKSREDKTGQTTQSREGQTGQTTQSREGQTTQSREGQTGQTTQSREGQSQGQTKTDRSQTTGAAATSATAAPPAEKRTQIVSAIKSEKVEEVRDVNFNLSVGTAVPTSVRFHPLPQRIVEIYPEWRGYQFILVHGKYVIIRPETHEIVYIIEG